MTLRAQERDEPDVQWSVLENKATKVDSLVLLVQVFLLLVEAQVRDGREDTRRHLSW